MSYMRHHAIVVTSVHELELRKAWKTIGGLCADEEGCDVYVSEITPKADPNGYQSFFIAPDGSNENWDESNTGNKLRARIKLILRSYEYEDKSTPLSWAEVQFGDENGVQKVVDASEMRVVVDV